MAGFFTVGCCASLSTPATDRIGSNNSATVEYLVGPSDRIFSRGFEYACVSARHGLGHMNAKSLGIVNGRGLQPGQDFIVFHVFGD